MVGEEAREQSMLFFPTCAGPHALFHAVQPSQSLHSAQTGNVQGHAARLWPCIVYTHVSTQQVPGPPTQGH